MRRAAILITCLVTFTFAGCNLYLDDDDRGGKNHPQGADVDAGPCCGGGTPDAGCGGPGHPDGGFLPDAGAWYPDAGFPPPPDASPDW